MVTSWQWMLQVGCDYKLAARLVFVNSSVMKLSNRQNVKKKKKNVMHQYIKKILFIIKLCSFIQTIQIVTVYST